MSERSSVDRRSAAPGAFPEEWIGALGGSLEAIAQVVLDPAVADAWTRPSVLDGYSVGGIAGHVLDVMYGLEERARSTHEGRVEEIIPVEVWYSLALDSPTGHPDLVEAGEALAGHGPRTVADALEQAARRLERQLRQAGRTHLIPVAGAPRAAVRLEDYLLTRFVEITVHAEDIVRSAGTTSAPVPPLAWQLAATGLSLDCSPPAARSRVLQRTRPS